MDSKPRCAARYHNMMDCVKILVDDDVMMLVMIMSSTGQ